ncbi:MAG TPA: flagellar basal body-associated FliL family protein [Aquifex aeolicus]|uniref:Flagellar protein FliL n=1 Tax=Aquifex aeolicus TaxID=63363 RepID=A0A7C5L9Q6_AQUAO|nr:flagellar basal body-associated FliL family protein [Aquifex aeolicus]
MADEEREEQQAEEKTGGGKGKLLLIALLLLILLGAGGGAAYFFLFAKKGDKKEEVPKPTVSPEAVGVMYKLEPSFIVNLADPEMTMYARVSITLEVSAPEVVLEVQKREPILRDAIIEILSNKTSRELRSPEGREQLKLEIIKRVNTILVQGGIRNVYFTEFVVQAE